MLLRYLVDVVILAILSLFAVLWGGCIAGMGYSTQDRVTEAAREYNDGVRWGRLEQAADHLQKDARDRFYERHKNVEDELEIADMEIVSLKVDKSDKKVTRATASVEYTWSLKRVGLVEKTITEQKWEEHNRDWVMVAETRKRGSPLTIFDEPAKSAKDEPAKK
jgi:hypothetical protein